MNEHLLRVYTNAAAPADRVASQRAMRQSQTQPVELETTRSSAPVAIKSHELKQLLSDDERDAISAMFTNGRAPVSYGVPQSTAQLSGKLIDRVV